ncbi:EutN/CcmL family microcompartment protein [Enterococcus rivorum]|uniref:Ethanolamine utilization protein EutN n=1 Tax=Enterococcus rivorum TaxID=762845 RepID=A0A1E5KWG2_9ENTE|nr:EutN/CcmL family microcompartment protein [Enterococcus rivorum]MBP2099068.1 ethanolamine utilization protein EutN [Enterococcus rivorum]OEH82210.1 ethanolamine utilization protein EutN [Enterococcus rivorum]
MFIGRVKGSLWATRKDEKLNGLKFLVVELDEYNGPQNSIVAADNAGAGLDDLVLISTGSSARMSLDNPDIPVDAVIVGIIDSVEMNE